VRPASCDPGAAVRDPREYFMENNLTEHPLELKIPPVIVFGFFALMMWAIAVYFPVFDITIPLRLYLTGFLIVVALYAGIHSILLFYRFKTSVHPQKPQEVSRLITDGPFKHTRNPMYLALSLVLIAWAIFLSDLIALMMMPAFYWYMTRFQIIPEERALISKFGEEYEEYVEKAPRWL